MGVGDIGYRGLVLHEIGGRSINEIKKKSRSFICKQLKMKIQ